MTRLNVGSIRHKVLFFGLLMSTIPLLLISIYYLYEMSKEVETKAMERQELQAENLANDIRSELQQIFKHIEILSGIEGIEGNAGLFYDLLSQQKSIDEIVILNENGIPEVMVSRFELNRWNPEVKWLTDKGIINHDFKNEKRAFSKVMFNEFGQPYIQLLTPIVGEENKSVGVSLQLQKIIGDLTSFQFQNKSSLYLIDQFEQIIAHQDYSRLWQDAAIPTASDPSMMVISTPIEEVNWSLVLEQPRKDMLSPIYDMLRRGGYTATILILLVSLISIFAGLNFVKPIERLQQGMRDLKYGYYPEAMKVNSKDEFGELTTAFNEMNKELKEKSNYLLQEKERLDIVVNSMEAGIAIVKKDYTISWMNPTLKEWIGTNEHVPCFQLFSNQDSPCYACPLNGTSGFEKTDDMITKMGKGGEIRIYRHRVYPLQFTLGEGEEALVVMEDITEEKQLEEKLIQTDKLSALGLMASSFAHEVNNPLATVQVYAEDLTDRLEEEKKELIESGEIQDYLHVIRKNIERCKEITTNLLNFSRKSQWSVHNLDIWKVLDDSLALVKHTLKNKNILLNVTGEKKLPTLVGDSLKMSQVFVNMIQNAVDAMEEKEKGELEIYIRTNTSEKQISISFKDNGVGIEKEMLSKLFDPFYTSKPAGKGTGLGLSVCYGIIKQFGGSIEVESTPGKGTKFSVSIPYEALEDGKGELI